MNRLNDLQADVSAGSARAARARRYIALARAVLTWERLWPALWPAMGFVGLYAAAALFGLFSAIPSVLHASLLVALFGAAGFTLWQRFDRTRFPRWEDAARRVERDSGLSHRQLSESHDKLAAGQGDELAESLWHAHMLWLLASAKRLRISLPHPGLANRDPFRLRYLVLIGVAAGIIVAGRQWEHRLIAGLTPMAPLSALTVALNAWVSPPAYTGLPPHAIGGEPTGREAGGHIIVPQGSVLILRVRGMGAEPGLRVHPTPHDKSPKFSQANAGYESKLTLQQNAHVSVRAMGRAIGDWRFDILPDKHPSIAFTEPPGTGTRNTLKLAYKAADDYGVVKTEARITLADDESDMKTQLVKGLGTLVVELPLPVQTKQFAQTVLRDLTAHPYAGMKVAIRLAAIDAAGQTTVTAPKIMVLPERVFTHPLARALIEQRKILASGVPDASTHAASVIDALTIAPERFFKDDYKTYLAMRGLYWQLRTVKNDKDVLAAMSYMWDMALVLEEGDVASAAQALRNAQQALMDALQSGAPDDEISALMQKLREAMDRYLQSLAQNGTPQGAPPPGSKMMQAQDLDQILKAIEELSRTGARDSAQQLLQGLAQLLQNLRVTQSAEPSPGDKAVSDAVKGLSDLMGDQRELLDRTFREQQGGQRQGNNALSNDQKGLKDRLGKITEGLGQKGVRAPDNLGQAGKEMGKSEQDLKSGQFGGSEFSQQDALDQLREGAKALAKQLTPQSGMEGMNGNTSEDPLGRQSGATGSDFGSAVKVPMESDLQRAREILQELRKRAADRNRPKEELDYIDRLLKLF